MQLSEHFDSMEFEDGGDAIPEECIPIFKEFCSLILEPIRGYIGEPMEITSGYRSAADNASPAVHGNPHSEHVATQSYCAADFSFAIVADKVSSVRAVFDWIRSNPAIPFHIVTLEHGAQGRSIIHISYNKDLPGIRKALEGATHNAIPYTHWEVVAYNPAAS